MEKIHSYKTLFFNIIATINYAFSPAMNKSLHAVLVKICTSGRDPLSPSPLLKCTTHRLTVLPLTAWSSSTFRKHQWMPMATIFLHMDKFNSYLSFTIFQFTIDTKGAGTGGLGLTVEGPCEAKIECLVWIAKIAKIWMLRLNCPSSITHHSVRLPLCCHVLHGKNSTEYWWEGSASTAIPPPSVSDIMGQHNKIGGTTFWAAIISIKRRLKHMPYKERMKNSVQP